MSIVLFDDREAEVRGEVRGGRLRIPVEQLEEATGWHLTPDGVCRGELCVPLPPGEGWASGGSFDLTAFAEHRRQGLARHVERDVWSFGPPPGPRLASGPAPDFTLPDFEGRLHSLSEYRGRKLLLLTWASW